LCTRGGGHGTAASGGVHDPLYHIIHVPFTSNNLKTHDRRKIIHRGAKNVRETYVEIGTATAPIITVISINGVLNLSPKTEDDDFYMSGGSHPLFFMFLRKKNQYLVF